MKKKVFSDVFTYIFPVLCMSVILFCCKADTREIEIKDSKGKVVEKYQVDPATEKKQGLYQRFYESGQLAEEAHYVRDTLDGARRFYFESGQLEREQHYLFGIFQGPFRSYYINGQLNAEGNYLNNEMDGVWKRYYDTGELMEEVTFVNNDENGPFRELYKNGKVKAEGSYINGPYEHGELKEYDEQGNLIRIMSCENGICNTTWKK